MMTGLTPVQLLRRFVAASDHYKRQRKKKAKAKRRRLDPSDWIRTPKKPKAKS